MVAIRMAVTDEALLAQATRGVRAAFDQLVFHHQSAIDHFALRFCGHRENACELAREIFVRVYLKISTFQPEASFRAWLDRIAANACLKAAARFGELAVGSALLLLLTLAAPPGWVLIQVAIDASLGAFRLRRPLLTSLAGRRARSCWKKREKGAFAGWRS